MPLLFFGQSKKSKSLNNQMSDTDLSPLIYEQNDNKWEQNYGLYNNVKFIKKKISYWKNKKKSEISFKGFKYKTIDVKNYDGRIKKETIQHYIEDGFARVFESNGDICFEEFYIFGKLIHSKDWQCKETYVNPIGNYSSDEINSSREYDLEFMVNLFLDDIINNNLERGEPSLLIKNLRLNRKSAINGIRISATFIPLDGNALALSYGMNDNKNIILKVDPNEWSKASSAKKWYTLYHELGHDVLNFEHGHGGKMMFNYSDEEYNWESFNDDRNYMFDVFLKKQPIQLLKKSKKF